MVDTKKVRVTILDDHQSIIDGYLFRLSRVPQVEVVSTIMRGEEIEASLKDHPTDVLLLDVNVPTAIDNPDPYPILHVIPSLLQQYPYLTILVISMYAERRMIRAVMEAGASGYILKDDYASIQDLGNILMSVANGGIYFSEKAHQSILKSGDTDALTALSTRQLEALSLSAAYPNNTTADLARKMSIANSSMRNLLSGAYIKLGVQTRAGAITKARQMGIIPNDPAAPTVPIRKR